MASVVTCWPLACFRQRWVRNRRWLDIGGPLTVVVMLVVAPCVPRILPWQLFVIIGVLGGSKPGSRVPSREYLIACPPTHQFENEHVYPFILFTFLFYLVLGSFIILFSCFFVFFLVACVIFIWFAPANFSF